MAFVIGIDWSLGIDWSPRLTEVQYQNGSYPGYSDVRSGDPYWSVLICVEWPVISLALCKVQNCRDLPWRFGSWQNLGLSMSLSYRVKGSRSSALIVCFTVVQERTVRFMFWTYSVRPCLYYWRLKSIIYCWFSNTVNKHSWFFRNQSRY